MRFLLLVMLMVSVVIFAGGCAQKKGEKPAEQILPKPLAEKVHGEASKQEGKKDYEMVTVVKKQFLEGYDAAPVGAAIDGYRYFTKKEWKESRNARGTYYIDLTGWLDSATLDSRSIKEGVAARGVQIKFVIYDNGSFGVAMMSKVEAKTDGKLYFNTLDDSRAIMDKIFANKEITF